MADLDERVTPEMRDLANRAMLELAQQLKRDFGLEALVDRAARNHNVALTPGAMLILVTPLVEAALAQEYRHSVQVYDNGLDADFGTVGESIDQLVGEAKSSPARADRVPQVLTGVDQTGREWPMRSSLSFMKAISKRFCKIPPFCGE